MDEIVYTANGVFPGKKLRGKSRYAKLYHYTSFDAFVKIWLSKSLRFSSVKNVNDVLESSMRSQVQIFNHAPLVVAYQELRSQYKQISFTMDYDSFWKGYMSPCMWGYYADKKKGVCIKLDFDKLVFSDDTLKSPILYRKSIKDATKIPNDILTIRQLHEFIQDNAKYEFFTKHIAWKGENEYRIISCTQDTLDINNAISAIYLTSYDSDECLFTEKLVNDEVSVKYLHFVVSNGLVHPDPDIPDTHKFRKIMNEAKMNPENVIQKIGSEATAFYEKHKNEPDYPLVMTEFNH